MSASTGSRTRSAASSARTPSGRLALYANVGPDLTHYDVDVEALTLTRRGTVTLPADVQYAWPHRSRRLLYVATSDTAPGNDAVPGRCHHITALGIDERSGALGQHGAPVALPTRPIHLSTDIPSQNILVAFNEPSALRVYRINADGTPGGEVRQPQAPDAGIYAHQVRVTPDNRHALLVTRGNEGTPARPEDPGAIKVFDYRDGLLANEVSIAPDGGRNFGPRHLDFHPTKPWIFLSIETQNQIALLQMTHEGVDPRLLVLVSTLDPARTGRARQAAGPIHVHPNGRFVYVTNRAEQTEDVDGVEVFKGGENSIAVFEIDQVTGAPRLIQHVDTQGIHPRTFHLDPSGRMMVVEHNLPVTVRDGAGTRTNAAGLCVFRVHDDGTLTFARKYDIDVGARSMFWMGMVDLDQG